jgi:hypothetical protein
MQMMQGGGIGSMSGEVKPVPAKLHALRHEYLIDAAKGRVVFCRRTSTMKFGEPLITSNEDSEIKETKRLPWTGEKLKSLRAAVLEMNEICRIELNDKAEAYKRAIALKTKVAKLDLDKTIERLVKRVQKSEMPPGFPRR